jgi:2-keto-4-pentenoate hydratase/2-oxohepta-3-ene-1,7-dioic acid hydratase in catechol pathway
MTTKILRTADSWWVTTSQGAARIDTDATTTGELLTASEAIDAASASKETVDPATLDLVSPVTAPCRVVAQMTNFASHVEDAGLKPESIPLTFFRKASGSISGPYDDIVRPAHVRFLDYEAEIGIVIGRELAVGTEVTEDNWTSFVAGLVVTNDVSARDVQLPKTQFFEGKSYPTFTPVGPSLLLLTDDELKRFGDLRLRLWVDGALRQDALVDGDMIYSPLQALQALRRFQRLEPGDLLLTGTPVGTALSAPPRPAEVIASLLPAATKWKLFFKAQARNPKYLQDGDVVEVAIATDDGAIDLGRQRTIVRAAR